ncbi:MAG: hypothetical protein E7090_04710 [Bacteroidales bacterium]|nr:hypothetical protein [Bacteroidales bacterium]
MKKDIIIVTTIFVVGILIAYGLNIALTYGNLIETSISKETWLNFWGSYCGGLFAIIIGFLAIVHSNRNSEKAINQQYMLLQQRHKEKRLDEYNKCLRNNLELMNAVDVVGITVAIDHGLLSTSKAEIVKKKSLIFSYDLQYRFVFEVDSNNNKTEIEEKYNNCWIEAHSLLSNLLDVQLNFIVRIGQNNAETHIKLNNQGIISALQRLIELSNNKNDIAKYQEKVAETHKEIELIEASIRIYKNDVDAMTIEIKHLMDMLLVKAKELYDLSILLMKEKENMPAEKFL